MKGLPLGMVKYEVLNFNCKVNKKSDIIEVLR